MVLIGKTPRIILTEITVREKLRRSKNLITSVM